MDTNNPVEEAESRPKLSISGQIAYMRDKRGIQFNIVSEEQATKFLESSNYYFKLKAFEKNYSTYTSPKHEKYGQYCDLEFAYLQELSTIDMYLREIVLAFSLDIEHYLKVRLLKDISENDAEDGYSIVKEFCNIQPQVMESIESKSHNSYCEALVRKYSSHYAVWTFVEVVSLGDLINFCEYYYRKYPCKEISIGNLKIVKFLRNAAAHNNCLINNLADNSGYSFKQNRMANSFVATIDGISATTRNKKMGNRTVHDFVVLLCTFNQFATASAKERQYRKLIELFDERFVRHKEYFTSNMLLVSNYDFVRKIVEKLANMC